jgi:plastocyanin
MKKLYVLLFFALVITFSGSAMVHTIHFSYPAYSPSGLSVSVGDTVLFKGSFEKFPLLAISVPTGANSFGCEKGEDFMYVVAIEGTYKYQCPTYKTNGMVGYFTAVALDKTAPDNNYNMVYFNYVSHAFHINTTDALPHGNYTITVAKMNGEVIYKTELKAEERDKWIATENFPNGTYMLTATDGTHSFGRKFTK